MLDRLRESSLWQLLIVLLVAAGVHLPLLGASGLSDSEGFRAIPAWEMLQTGEPLVTTLFGQPYLRKPPGIVWAIAGVSSVLGQTELAARSVSALAAIVGALACFVFATRWWGRPWGLWAGLAFTLTPWFWRWARSAEIESLHNTLILLTVLGCIHLLAVPRRGVRSVVLVLLTGLSFGAAMLTKGPAGLACIAGGVLGVCAALRSFRPLLRPGLWLALGLGSGIFAAWFFALAARIDAAGLHPVVEPPSKFLWRSGELLGVLLLAPSTLLAALPWTIALPLALLGPRLPARGSEADANVVGRSLAWGCIIALAIETLAGVSNNRYAMPAITWMPCIYAFALWRHHHAASDLARTVGRAVCLSCPFAVSLVVAALSIGHLFWFEGRRDSRTSGRAAGLEAGALLPAGTLWADQLADTRPEVLWYAQEAARQHGHTVRVRWLPGLARYRPLPGPMVALLSAKTNEPGLAPEVRPEDRAGGGVTGELACGKAHVFEFVVLSTGGGDVPSPVIPGSSERPSP